jgi:hypothetical protein
MYYGVARLEFLVPHSQSLKEKRSVLNRLKDRLENRLKIAVAEVEFQDLWQRGALGVALVAHAAGSARDGLQAVRREAERDLRITVLDFQLQVGRFGDRVEFGDESADDSADDSAADSALDSAGGFDGANDTGPEERP